jgi:hypothetical protein
LQASALTRSWKFLANDSGNQCRIFTASLRVFSHVWFG